MKIPDRIAAERPFWTLWASALLSEIGAQVSRVSLVLAFSANNGAIRAVGLLVLCETLPGALTAFFSGAIVDRSNRRNVMAAMDAARAAAIGCALLDLTAGVIYAVVALGSAAGAFFGPARSALLPCVVTQERLPRANAMDQAASMMVMIAGPALGAELFLNFGLRATLATDAATYLVSAALALTIPASIGRPAGGIPESPAAAVWAGWRYLAGHSLARHMVSLGGLSLLCVGLWIPVAPVFIRDFLHASGRTLGLQLSLFGAGGLVGSLGAPLFAARLGKGATVTFALFGEAVIMLVYATVPHAALSTAIILVWGAVVSITIVNSNALLQECVSRAFSGRVFALLRQVESAATVAAVLWASALQKRMPASHIFLSAALVYLTCLALSRRLPGGRELAHAR
jgi:MFS family permease